MIRDVFRRDRRAARFAHGVAGRSGGCLVRPGVSRGVVSVSRPAVDPAEPSQCRGQLRLLFVADFSRRTVRQLADDCGGEVAKIRHFPLSSDTRVARSGRAALASRRPRRREGRRCGPPPRTSATVWRKTGTSRAATSGSTSRSAASCPTRNATFARSIVPRTGVPAVGAARARRRSLASAMVQFPVSSGSRLAEEPNLCASRVDRPLAHRRQRADDASTMVRILRLKPVNYSTHPPATRQPRRRVAMCDGTIATRTGCGVWSAHRIERRMAVHDRRARPSLACSRNLIWPRCSRSSQRSTASPSN